MFLECGKKCNLGTEINYTHLIFATQFLFPFLVAKEIDDYLRSIVTD